MKYFKFKNQNRGFTLIETLVAIFVLTLALDGLFALTANSLFSARYAKNEITANYLLQEAVDYIRNDRDSIAFQQAADPANGGWGNFLAKYGFHGPGQGSLCFSQDGTVEGDGCSIEPADNTGTDIMNPTNIYRCDPSTKNTIDGCKPFFYDESSSNKDFYTYRSSADGTQIESIFRRQVVMLINKDRPDELDVRINVSWHNANQPRSRSLWFSLLNWQNVASSQTTGGGNSGGGGCVVPYDTKDPLNSACSCNTPNTVDVSGWCVVGNGGGNNNGGNSCPVPPNAGLDKSGACCATSLSPDGICSPGNGG